MPDIDRIDFEVGGGLAIESLPSIGDAALSGQRLCFGERMPNGDSLSAEIERLRIRVERLEAGDRRSNRIRD